MGGFLSKPVTDVEQESGDCTFAKSKGDGKSAKEKSNGTSGRVMRVQYGAASMQGWRTENEDAHRVLLDLTDDISLFSVFDGHGGTDVSRYCAKYLPDYLIERIGSCDRASPEGLALALHETFLGIDVELLSEEGQERLHAILEEAFDEHMQKQQRRETAEGESDAESDAVATPGSDSDQAAASEDDVRRSPRIRRNQIIQAVRAVHEEMDKREEEAGAFIEAAKASGQIEGDDVEEEEYEEGEAAFDSGATAVVALLERAEASTTSSSQTLEIRGASYAAAGRPLRSPTTTVPSSSQKKRAYTKRAVSSRTRDAFAAI